MKINREICLGRINNPLESGLLPPPDEIRGIAMFEPKIDNQRWEQTREDEADFGFWWRQLIGLWLAFSSEDCQEDQEFREQLWLGIGMLMGLRPNDDWRGAVGAFVEADMLIEDSGNSQVELLGRDRLGVVRAWSMFDKSESRYSESKNYQTLEVEEEYLSLPVLLANNPEWAYFVTGYNYQRKEGVCRRIIDRQKIVVVDEQSPLECWELVKKYDADKVLGYEIVEHWQVDGEDLQVVIETDCFGYLVRVELGNKNHDEYVGRGLDLVKVQKESKGEELAGGLRDLLTTRTMIEPKFDEIRQHLQTIYTWWGEAQLIER